MKILISIVTFHSNLKILNDVLSLLKKDYNDDLVISIFDNSSSNEINNISHKLGCLYTRSANIGYGLGHNKNINIQSKNYQFESVVILNPDVLISYEQIKSLILKLNIKDIIVSPNLLNPDHSQQDFIRKFPTIFSFFTRFFNLSKKFSYKYSKSKFQLVPFVHGACYVVKLSTFKKLGLFDGRFFMYCEDLDLCRSAFKRGNGVYVDRTINVIHFHNRESKRSIKLFIIHMISIFKYFLKWGFFLDNNAKSINYLYKSESK